MRGVRDAAPYEGWHVLVGHVRPFVVLARPTGQISTHVPFILIAGRSPATIEATWAAAPHLLVAGWEVQGT